MKNAFAKNVGAVEEKHGERKSLPRRVTLYFSLPIALRSTRVRTAARAFMTNPCVYVLSN